MAGSLRVDSTAERSPSRGGSWVLVVFALPFCGVGVFMGIAALQALGRGEPWSEELVARVLFALVFGGAGFGILAASLWSRRKTGTEQGLRERHPDHPWMWREEWASGRVPSRDGATAVVAWVFAFFWNLISAPLLWVVPEEAADGNAVAWIGLLFPVVGIGLLVWAVRATLRYRRFGRAVFEMHTLPGVRGGPLRGTVHVPTALRPEDGFRVRLACVNRVTTGHGKSRSTHEHVRWEETRRVGPEGFTAGPMGTAVPVSFVVPWDVEPSSVERSRDMILWRLEVSAAVPGVDFDTGFEVPVFETSESSTAVDESAAAPDPAAAAPAPTLGPHPTPLAEGSRITVRALPEGGLELHFPAARNPKGALALTGFAVFWNGIVGLAFGMAPAFVWPFLAIFGLVGLLLAFAALDAWAGSVRLRVGPGRLERTGRLLGIGGTRTWTAPEVEGFTLDTSGRNGSQVHYAVRVEPSGGGKARTLAGGIADKARARRVVSILEDAFGAPGRASG